MNYENERIKARNSNAIISKEELDDSLMYQKILCPDCLKEKIRKVSLLKEKFQCSDCKGLDSLEKRTGFRGVLKNPSSMQLLEDGCYEKLGCRRPFCSKDVQEKVSIALRDDTTGKRKLMGFTDTENIQKKYGVNNVMELPEFREKIIKSLANRADGYYNKNIDNSFDFSKMNNLEKKLYNYIKDYKLQFANRNALGYMEIDFYNYEDRVGYEACGDYWHTILQKGKSYHLRKYSLAISKNIRLFQFFESEVYKLESIIKSYVTEDFEREFIVELGDSSEFDFFNTSYYNSKYSKFLKIKDSKGGRYISAVDEDGLIIFPSNERGSLLNAYKELNKNYDIIVDNRLCPVLEEGEKVGINLLEKKQGLTEDAGMKIFKRGFYEN